MLEQVFWNYFEKTGEIDAYVVSKEINNFGNNSYNEFSNNEVSSNSYNNEFSTKNNLQDTFKY